MIELLETLGFEKQNIQGEPHTAVNIFTYSKEEIYLKFSEAFPDFVNNVPQYLVATYLGLSPEYVSKIRRKRFS